MPDECVFKQDVINALVEKGQASKRYKLGEIWELNGKEILEAVGAMKPADVVLRSCFNRILAENDTMREQLASIGKKPGDKMDDVRIAKFGVWRHSWAEGRFVYRCSNCNYFLAGNPHSAKVCPGCMGYVQRRP